MADSKISALSDGSSLQSGDQLVVARSSANKSVLAQHLPGWEIGYTQITAPVNVASTTESTGTTIISPGALTFDGSPVICHFFAPYVKIDSVAAGDSVVVSLFEGATQIGRLLLATTFAAGIQFDGARTGLLRFTPSAGSHTYTVTAHATSTTGTPQVGAGVGGTGAYVAAFVRFTKA